jgi:hypothetical protein
MAGVAKKLKVNPALATSNGDSKGFRRLHLCATCGAAGHNARTCGTGDGTPARIRTEETASNSTPPPAEDPTPGPFVVPPPQHVLDSPHVSAYEAARVLLKRLHELRADFDRRIQAVEGLLAIL